VAGVCVCDDGTEEIDVRGFGAFFERHVHSGGTLFSVVEALGHEELFDLAVSEGFLVMIPYWGLCPLGNLRDLGRVRWRWKRWRSIASRKHRQFLGTLPFV